MKANQRMGRGVAQQELAIARARAKILKEETSARVSKYKAEQKALERDRVKREKFVKAVESQNVRGIIPPVENRGVHNMVVHDPFSPPQKELVRDKNGFLSVKENNTEPKKSIWM